MRRMSQVTPIAVLALAAACKSPAPPPAPPPPPTRMEQIVTGLKSPDPGLREAALSELRSYTADGIPESEGLIAVRAAAEKLPPLERSEFADPAHELLRSVSREPKDAYLPVVVEVFGRYGDRAKLEGLELLTQHRGEAATHAYLQVLRQHAAAGGVPQLPVKEYQREPRFAGLLFPELFRYTVSPRLTTSVLELALTYANEGLLERPVLEAITPRLLELYRPLPEKLRQAAAAGGAGTDWTRAESYFPLRFDAEVLLDLFGFIRAGEADAALREALGFADRRLVLFAAISLLRKDLPVPKERVELVSADPELRRWLQVFLKRAGKEALLPARYRTQTAMAEMDMVHWLLDSKALGVAPDRIQLMKVLTIEPDARMGPLDYYVFRFQMPPAHPLSQKGWLAGVSGPFRRKDGPSFPSLGDTFSDYEPWGARTPEEHAQLEENRARREEEAAEDLARLMAAADECRPDPSAHRCTVPLKCQKPPFSAPAPASRTP